MHSFTEVIDVRKAQQYLTGAETKRSPSRTSVQQYAGDMANGRWYLSHQGLLFAPNHPEGTRGPLEDGGHRMQAVIEADKIKPGIAVEFWVTVQDKPGEVNFAGIDYGRNRTMANMLQINGYKHYSQLGAITRRILLWEAGNPYSRRWSPSKLAILERIEAEPEIEIMAQYAHGWSGPLTKLLPPAAVGFCYWLFQHIDEDDCKQFLYMLREGADLPLKSPVHTLRERLHGGDLSSKRYPGRDPEIRIALTILAWNKYRGSVERVGKYQLPNPLNDESFPRPV